MNAEPDLFPMIILVPNVLSNYPWDMAGKRADIGTFKRVRFDSF